MNKSRPRYKYGGYFRGSWLGWGYQEYAYDDLASGANANIITVNSNGDRVKFSADRIVSDTAIVCRGGTDRTLTELPIYTGSLKLFSSKIKVTAHTTDSVTLSGTPHSSRTPVRIYFLYRYDFGCPKNYEFPSKTISGKMFDELNALLVTEEEQTAALSDYLPLAGGTMAGNIAMGGNNLTGVGDVNADRVLAGSGGFNINNAVDITAVNASNVDFVNHRGTTSADQFVTQFRSADNDGSDRVQLVITGKGSFDQGDPGASHYLQMRWNGVDAYEIFTTFGSEETFKPLNIGTHTDPSMLIVNETTLNTTVPLIVSPSLLVGSTVHIDSAGIQSVATDPDNTNVRSMGATSFVALNAGGGTFTSGDEGVRVYDGGVSNFIQFKPGSINDSSGAWATSNFVGIGGAAVTNEMLRITMPDTATAGICVDGDTSPYDYASGIPAAGFNIFSRTLDGSGIPASSRTHSFNTIWDVNLSGSGLNFLNKSIDNMLGLFTITGDFSATGGWGAGADPKTTSLNCANYTTNFTGNLTTNNTGSRSFNPRFVGFNGVSNFNPASITSTDGFALYQVIGATFKASTAGSISNTHSLDNQTLEFIGIDAVAEGQSGITNLPTTSIAIKASATGSDINNAIQVYAGDTILLKTRVDGNVGFYGTTPVSQNQLATGAGATVDNVVTELQRLGLVRQAA